MTKLSHINSAGEAQMVDVSEKPTTVRQARAEALLNLSEHTLQMIIAGEHPKGDVFAAARLAGIQAAKKTWDLIPLCHPLMLTNVDVRLTPLTQPSRILIETCCRVNGQTGVEMEALTAASVAALTLYDMCKAVQKDMIINSIRLVEKTGGKSTDFRVTAHD